MIAEILGELQRRFEAEADATRAAGAAAYMRGQFSFYGIDAPSQRRIARDVTAGLPSPTEKQLAAMARRCWKRPQREWQYFACGYLRRHITIASAGFIDVAEELVTAKSWWDTVDALASRTVGPLVQIYPELRRTMDTWATAENIWLARAAILHQLTFKARTDAGRLFHYAELRTADTEFFIRKAIGWALREYSKTDGAAVRRFVKTHPQLSTLSRTEALKWLER